MNSWTKYAIIFYQNGKEAGCHEIFAWKENFAKADALIVENRPLPMFLCRVLASRGIKDSASAETFLNCTQPLCDPMELHDMEKQ